MRDTSGSCIVLLCSLVLWETKPGCGFAWREILMCACSLDGWSPACVFFQTLEVAGWLFAGRFKLI